MRGSVGEEASEMEPDWTGPMTWAMAPGGGNADKEKDALGEDVELDDDLADDLEDSLDDELDDDEFEDDDDDLDDLDDLDDDLIDLDDEYDTTDEEDRPPSGPPRRYEE